jgi:membrane glycosyltransferase
VRELAQNLLVRGPAGRPREELLLVMSDADTMSWMHRQSWIRPPEALAPFWHGRK